MSEIERIINKGIISEAFLKEEIRNDFLVTTERKKIWMILLDMLIEIDRVCKKNNIKYTLGFGSILGAVRHKGFIPWDDDIDICMPRDDYERFLNLQSEFQYPYFLQTPYSDKNSAYSWAKLRNASTTMVSRHFAYQEMNHGILIDIFPYDKWDPSDDKSYDIIKYLALENSTFMRLTNPNLDESGKKRVQSWAGIDSINVYETIQKIAQKHNKIDTIFVAVAVCTIYEFNKMLFYKEDFDDIINMEFEGFLFPVPKGYDRMLKNVYGDYMEFPPVDKRGQWHNDLYINTEIPYKDYLHM